MWIKQRLYLSPARSFCPSSPMDCLGWKFPPDCLPCPQIRDFTQAAQLLLIFAFGFLLTFFLLGQQLSHQWNCAGLPKTQPGCSFNCWLILASQVVPCPLYLKIVTLSREIQRKKGSCFLLPLCLSAQIIPCCIMWWVFLLIICFGYFGFDIMLVYLAGAVLDLS